MSKPSSASVTCGWILTSSGEGSDLSHEECHRRRYSVSLLCLAFHLYRPRVGGEVRVGGCGWRERGVGQRPPAGLPMQILRIYKYIL